jgi:hypothetical protein
MGNFKLGLGIWDIILEGTGNERRVMPCVSCIFVGSKLTTSVGPAMCILEFVFFFSGRQHQFRNLLKLHSDGSQYSGKPLSPFSVDS